MQEELGKLIPKVQAQQPDDPWEMHQACCHLLRFDMVQLAPCHHVQFGDGLCNLSQELLDYLKQFDTDGKGALSEEELQEVMRGRIRRA